MGQRVCVVSEDLSGAPDEGIKKSVLALADSLGHLGRDILLLSTEGAADVPNARLAPASRTFLSRALQAEIAHYDPQVLLYIPRSSTTSMAFVRSRVLKMYCPEARVALIGFQMRRHSAIQQRLVRYLLPDLVCVQSRESQRYLETLGCRVGLIPSGVDTEIFQPVEPQRRLELRTAYGLRHDIPVVLHVGHLKRGRGIHVLAELALRGDCQVVLVASSSTEQEAGVANELRRAGVLVLTGYLPHVEHIYQLADCYAFPVQSTDNAIEVPLSVLEALACDLPVVTTRFAGLPQLFGSQKTPSLVFVESSEALVRETISLCRSGSSGARTLALPYSWRAVAMSLLDHIEAMNHVEKSMLTEGARA